MRRQFETRILIGHVGFHRFSKPGAQKCRPLRVIQVGSCQWPSHPTVRHWRQPSGSTNVLPQTFGANVSVTHRRFEHAGLHLITSLRSLDLHAGLKTMRLGQIM